MTSALWTLRGLWFVAGASLLYGVGYRLQLSGFPTTPNTAHVLAFPLLPIIALTAVVLALRPQILRPLLYPESAWLSLAYRGALLAVAVLYEWSFISGPMWDKLLNDPSGFARGMGLLFTGGVVFHAVLQHWFLVTVTGGLLAIYPSLFKPLIAPPVAAEAPEAPALSPEKAS